MLAGLARNDAGHWKSTTLARTAFGNLKCLHPCLPDFVCILK